MGASRPGPAEVRWPWTFVLGHLLAGTRALPRTRAAPHASRRRVGPAPLRPFGSTLRPGAAPARREVVGDFSVPCCRSAPLRGFTLTCRSALEPGLGAGHGGPMPALSLRLGLGVRIARFAVCHV